MFPTFHTPRLSLAPLQSGDHVFIRELVNSKGWLDFIGNRNVNTETDALAYIQKIIDNPLTCYWVVRLRHNSTPIGVVTRIQRDYLEHHDIGFAFLPGFNGKGYAREAGKIILYHLAQDPRHTQVLATTVPENIRSIQLLEKLGLRFLREIAVDNEKLLLYGIASNEIRHSFA